MIVTERDRGSKAVSASDLHSRSIAVSLPPAYQTVFTNPPVSPQPTPTQHLLEPECREHAWKRFLKAFCFAAIISILLALLTKSFVSLAKQHGVEDVPTGPTKEDGHIIGCMRDMFGLRATQRPLLSPSPPLYHLTLGIPIPVSYNLAFLLSRGSYARGSVKFELSNSTGDSIEVLVAVGYHNMEALRRADVCLLGRDEGGQGVGIFTPRRLRPSSPKATDQLTVDVTIYFPKTGTREHPLVINALDTDMSAWSHQIDALEGRVVFKSLSIKASDSPIRGDSVSANFAQLKTSNQPITGSFNVSNSLSLITSNAAITATLRLENRDGNKATQLEMKTSNGPIEAPITLISTDQSSSPVPAAFTVIAETSNKPLALAFPEAPSSPFSRLKLSGKTSNAAANVELHPTYEGAVALKTSNAGCGFIINTEPTDPSGGGRQHHLRVRKQVNNVWNYGVWWGDDSKEEEGKGSVEVTTSNARNYIKLN